MLASLHPEVDTATGQRGEDESEVLTGVPGEGPKAVAALVVSGVLYAAPRQLPAGCRQPGGGERGERGGAVGVEVLGGGEMGDKGLEDDSS